MNVSASHRPVIVTRLPAPFLSSVRPVIRFAASAMLCVGVAGCSAQSRQAASIDPATTPAPSVAQAEASPGAMARVASAARSVTSTVTTPIVNAASAVKSYLVADRAKSVRRPGPAGQGLASWYGDQFHGRRTANGETFDMAGFTAAHPSFPLPSYVRVTNVSNGRSIVVRVNDRGPYRGGRMIDVSRRTADVLGFRGAGVGNVKLDYIGLAPVASRDDRKLVATYQEFGRPTAPEGVQIASLRTITDRDLMNEAGGGSGTLVARADPVAQPRVRAAPQPVAVAAPAPRPSLPDATRPAAGPELASVGLVKPVQIARVATPSPTVIPAKPAGASQPAAETAKRVIQPGEPALASLVPPVHAAPAAVPGAKAAETTDVASRVASTFDSFGSAAFAPAAVAASPLAAAYAPAR